MKKQEISSTSGEKKEKVGEKNTQKSSRKGKTPKQIVDKHIKDEHDVISDEEFKNVDLNLGVEGDSTHEPLELPETEERPKDEDKDHDKLTPWDVLKG